MTTQEDDNPKAAMPLLVWAAIVAALVSLLAYSLHQQAQDREIQADIVHADAVVSSSNELTYTNRKTGKTGKLVLPAGYSIVITHTHSVSEPK